MKLVEIRRESELSDLRAAWDKLVEHCATASIFVTWEWVTAWWSSYGVPGELSIFAAYGDGGELWGIAPLRRRKEQRYGQTVRMLSFLGDGSNDSDYLDFIIEAGFEREVMALFCARFAAEMKQGVVLEFNDLLENSPNLPYLQQFALREDMIWTEASTPCSTVRLPENWEAYLGSLSGKFRKQIRALLRKLEERSDVKFGVCANLEEVERLLPQMFDLHTRRWAEEGKPGVFRWDRKQVFYSAVSAKMLDRGRLHFSWIQWGEKIVACQYGFVFGDVYWHLQEGHEPASEHWSFGTALRAWSIREFFKEGIREYDFLNGAGWHKKIWGSETKASKRILVAQKSAGNILFCRGPEWAANMRESVGALLPEKVLEVRRAMLQQRARHAVGGQGGIPPISSTKQLILKTAAKCFYYLQAPALMRPVQERYQLAMSVNGSIPKVSWKRRQQPSVRILCYHRINDNNDPFFPALRTSIFERHMRFLARHYKVVSLANAMEYLHGNTADPVLVLTFDDGYEDNYRNAFPILQRYGLPATVFLTTGSLDAQQPPWFSRMAHAFKTTSREFFDLELDIPRRFGLRTEAERLDANGRVFSLLRSLPDTERQAWFQRILADLGPEMPGNPDRMLDWNQVRVMKTGGIDFGSHTVNHPFLSRLTREQAAWELSESKRRIEQELQFPTVHFAYPNGREPDLEGWNKEVLRETGYQAAVSTIWGPNFRFTDPMELRRGQPWEEDQALFAYKMAWYQLTNV